MAQLTDGLLASRLAVVIENEPFRDFAHGSSLDNIRDIVENGFNSSKAKANSSGGRVNRPGSFFAVALPQDGGIQIAYEFGLRKDYRPAILIMRLPENKFLELEEAGDALSRPIAGAEYIMETIFRPSSFDVLNLHAEFPEIIQLNG